MRIVLPSALIATERSRLSGSVYKVLWTSHESASRRNTTAPVSLVDTNVFPSALIAISEWRPSMAVGDPRSFHEPVFSRTNVHIKFRVSEFAPLITARSPRALSATLVPCLDCPVCQLPTSFPPDGIHWEPTRTQIHAAPTLLSSPAPPTMIVRPSALIATPTPCSAVPIASEPDSLGPCWIWGGDEGTTLKPFMKSFPPRDDLKTCDATTRINSPVQWRHPPNAVSHATRVRTTPVRTQSANPQTIANVGPRGSRRRSRRSDCRRSGR